MRAMLRRLIAALVGTTDKPTISYDEANRLRSTKAAATRAERIAVERRARLRTLRASIEADRGPIKWRHPV